MAEFRIVKLIDTDKFPQHCGVEPIEKKSFNDWRGKEIAIHAGTTPFPNWTCGTERVFRVTNESLARMGFSPAMYGCAFICEHQFTEVEG